MQSFYDIIDIINKPTTLHVKATFASEVRRFSVPHTMAASQSSVPATRYSDLEKMVITLFSLDSSVPMRILFQDDEGDWVTISSDEELLCATQISASPLRLTIHATKQAQVINTAPTPAVSAPAPTPTPLAPTLPPVPSKRYRVQHHPVRRIELESPTLPLVPLKRVIPTSVTPSTSPSPLPSTLPLVPLRSIETRKPLTIEERKVLKQGRLNSKCEHLSEKITRVEDLLQSPSLPDERKRTLAWKLAKLNAVLEVTKSAMVEVSENEEVTTAAPENSCATPASVNEPIASDFGRCGRRCGRRGRPLARLQVHRTDAAFPSSPDPIMKSNDKLERREYLVSHLGPQIEKKKECAKKLREARVAGSSEEELREYRQALIQARCELKGAKKELFTTM